MPNHTITVAEFCAGYAGLGLGLKRALGESMRTVAYCELEGFAQANLVSKMEAGLLDAAPVWSDLRSFPYAKFRGLVDIACAGIPCQPHSHAGKRLGGADERFLFDDWLTGLEAMRPRYIFIENVEGLLSSKMPDGTLCIHWTVERLEAMDYRVAVGIFSAAEVGAPHQRKRVFILAKSRGVGSAAGLPGSESWHEGHARIADHSGHQDCWPSRPGEPQHGWEPPRVVANAIGGRGEEPAIVNADLPTESSGRYTEDVGHAPLGQDDGREPGDMAVAQGCGERGDDAAGCAGEGVEHTPSPRCDRPVGRPEGEARDEARLPVSSAGCEGVADTKCIMRQRGTVRIGWRPGSAQHTEGNAAASGGSGYAVWQAEPTLGGDPDGSAGGLDYAKLCVTSDNRTDELRLLGNGVVPAVATKAFITLASELFTLDIATQHNQHDHQIR